jgi:hypothetical protein
MSHHVLIIHEKHCSFCLSRGSEEPDQSDHRTLVEVRGSCAFSDKTSSAPDNSSQPPEEHEEIDVTKEMVDAGIEEFLTYRFELSDPPEEAVKEIFTAMMQAPRALS